MAESLVFASAKMRLYIQEYIMIVYYGRGEWNRIKTNKIVIYNNEDGFWYVIK